MQTVESKPATGSSATPEPDDLVKPETPYSAEREKDEAERKVLETERDGSLSKARALQLLRDGAVTAETRARTEYVTSRLRDIDEREIALEPLVREEERKALIYNQKVGWKQREANRSRAAEVQSKIDEMDAQRKQLEDDLHYWKNKAPDGLFNANTALGKHRIKYPNVVEEER